jgi:hypothetical protein
MKVHVNLLHPDEQRYQGLVSRRFILLSSVTTVTLVLVLVGGFALYGFFNKRQDLNWARMQWQKTEPRYKIILALQQEQSRIKTVVGELNGWNHARLPMHELLTEVQRTVAPHPIQFTRLNVSSEFVLIQPPTPTNTPPAEVAGEAQSALVVKTAPKPPPPIHARRFHLAIAGRVLGAEGHTAVVEFNDQLQHNARIGPWFESVRLQGLNRAGGEARKNEQFFTIEGQTPVRRLE